MNSKRIWNKYFGFHKTVEKEDDKRPYLSFRKTSILVEDKTDADIEHVIQVGIKNAIWSGRFEVIGENPLFIIDGAHNEDAVKQLAITIENSFTNQKIDFIIGILADKEHEKMLEYVMPFARRVFKFNKKLAFKYRIAGQVLAEEVRKLHSDVKYCETIEEAVNRAILHSKETECPILAFGSLSYLGQLKAYLNTSLLQGLTLV